MAYPSPASQSITISWPTELVVKTIRVVGIDGKLALETTLGSISNTALLDVSDLAAGMYVVELVALNNKTSLKKQIQVIR